MSLPIQQAGRLRINKNHWRRRQAGREAGKKAAGDLRGPPPHSYKRISTVAHACIICIAHASFLRPIRPGGRWDLHISDIAPCASYSASLHSLPGSVGASSALGGRGLRQGGRKGGRSWFGHPSAYRARLLRPGEPSERGERPARTWSAVWVGEMGVVLWAGAGCSAPLAPAAPQSPGWRTAAGRGPQAGGRVCAPILSPAFLSDGLVASVTQPGSRVADVLRAAAGSRWRSRHPPTDARPAH